METIRWGFLGCGKISSDFINASKALPNVKFVACAARSLESAQKFSKTHGK
jgi:dihydrodiol dehydrogenase / D-xylose 1-dehydrogenase (NADP)